LWTSPETVETMSAPPAWLLFVLSWLLLMLREGSTMK
jgi:hypothetical protein